MYEELSAEDYSKFGYTYFIISVIKGSDWEHYATATGTNQARWQALRAINDGHYSFHIKLDEYHYNSLTMKSEEGELQESLEFGEWIRKYTPLYFELRIEYWNGDEEWFQEGKYGEAKTVKQVKAKIGQAMINGVALQKLGVRDCEYDGEVGGTMSAIDWLNLYENGDGDFI